MASQSAPVTPLMRVDQGESPGCVTGAGAVVTRSTEPLGVYAGVPARLIRRRGKTGAEANGGPALPPSP